MTIKKILLSFVFLCCSSLVAFSQDLTRQVDNLTTIDPDIVRYFPRWTICEQNIQLQVYQAFRLFGRPVADGSTITVVAAPKQEGQPFELLLIECDGKKFNAAEVEAKLKNLANIIRGTAPQVRRPDGEMTEMNFNILPYCHTMIPPDYPSSPAQSEAIVNFFEPTNVNHAISLSLFDQIIKVGNTGFWLHSMYGTDEVGYHFLSAGEAKIVLRRPLYENTDPNTKKQFPFLINAHLGGGYRLTTGLGGSVLEDVIPDRRLNGTPGGKIIGGLDWHIGSIFDKPEFGIRVNAELPLRGVGTEGIDASTYAMYPDEEGRIFSNNPNVNPLSIVPILRATGQVTAFYHWWLDPANPENYFRFDVGVNYTEIREFAYFDNTTVPGSPLPFTGITNTDIEGLNLYKPQEALDWLYAKVEYRSQSTFPFGASVQLSNQILMARAYIPLFGRWLYLEGKYATVLRDAQPFELSNFFMISPVLRLTL